MSRRAPLIAGNWKMNHGVGETQSYIETLLAGSCPAGVEIVLFPPFVALPAAAMLLTGSAISLGAQNVHWSDAGAFTGEVSAAMLVEVGARWAIVGHSERRTLFGETDASALARARRAQDEGLSVIFCIGETLAERDADTTFAVLERQTAELAALDADRLAVAYEPVWAIGTGRNATPTQAQEAHAWIRQRLAELFSSSAAAHLRVVYGGSLKPSNAAELLACPDVDGGLIGGASLDAASFSAIIRAAAESVAEEKP